MKNISIFLIFFILPFLGFNQTIGVGGSALYNIQSKSFSVGARSSIYTNNTLSFVP
jgi:hypothetical protein